MEDYDMTDVTILGVKLDSDTRERLKLVGKLKDRSLHWLIKTAILEYLEREERYEREKCEDMERWERYQRTGECITEEAMTAWLDELERRP